MEERVVTGHVADDARLDDGVAPGKGSTEPSQASSPQASDAAAGPGPIVEPGKDVREAILYAASSGNPREALVALDRLLAEIASLNAENRDLIRGRLADLTNTARLLADSRAEVVRLRWLELEGKAPLTLDDYERTVAVLLRMFPNLPLIARAALRLVEGEE